MKYLNQARVLVLHNTGVQHSGYIFHALNDTNKKLSKETVRNHWNKVLKQLGIQLRIHDLRHLISGILVSNGKTLEQMASVLGFTSTSVTKCYSKVRQEVAAKSLEDFFTRVR